MTASYPAPSWPQKPSKDLPLPLAMRPAVAARAIGVCERTLWTLTKRGEIPHSRIGGVVIYPTAAIMRWLEEQTINPPAKRPEAARGGDA
jgi:hypothetical protein